MKSLARGSIFIEILFCASFARRSRYFADQPPAPVRATDEGGPAPQLEVLECGAQEVWIGPRLTDRVDHAERRAGGDDLLEAFAERKERRVHVTPSGGSPPRPALFGSVSAATRGVQAARQGSRQPHAFAG